MTDEDEVMGNGDWKAKTKETRRKPDEVTLVFLKSLMNHPGEYTRFRGEKPAFDGLTFGTTSRITCYVNCPRYKFSLFFRSVD
jgi:hypothetical protein